MWQEEEGEEYLRTELASRLADRDEGGASVIEELLQGQVPGEADINCFCLVEYFWGGAGGVHLRSWGDSNIIGLWEFVHKNRRVDNNSPPFTLPPADPLYPELVVRLILCVPQPNVFFLSPEACPG